MIRKAKEEDYPILMDIWESAVLATHDFLSEEDFKFYKSRLPVYFQYVSLYCFEDEEGRIEAFLGVSYDNIEMLFVHNSFRGIGIGKTLLQFAINDLKIQKVDVNEDNHQALEFYKRYDFKQIGRSQKDSESKKYPILHLSL